MPSYSSKKEVQDKLNKARKELKKQRERKPRDEDKIRRALNECKDLQYVLDSWDALHS